MERYDVIIVGAGIAGLAAARKLQESGVTSFLILEAQDYLGGRIKSDQLFGSRLELGAEFVHGENTSLWSYLQASGTELKPDLPFGERKVVDADGNEYAAEDEAIFNEVHHACSEQGEIGVSIYDNVMRYLPSKTALGTLIARSLGNYEGDDPELLDSGAYAFMESSTDGNGNNWDLPSGYAPLISYMADGLPVRMNCPVRAIIQEEDGVRIVTDMQEFVGSKVIITVSLGVLKAGVIEFQPSIPGDIQQAIDRLSMGNCSKLLLKFSDATAVDALFAGRSGPKRIIHHDFKISSWWRSAAENTVVVGYVTGSQARQAATEDEQELCTASVAALSKIAKQDLAAVFEGGRLVTWDKNPYVRGAYSNHPVGVHPDVRQALARPFGKIYFAGGAANVSGNYATVHGALESGLAAADNILCTLL